MVLKRAIFRTRDSLSQVELKRAVHPVVHPKNGKINRIRSGLESHPLRQIKSALISHSWNLSVRFFYSKYIF